MCDFWAQRSSLSVLALWWLTLDSQVNRYDHPDARVTLVRGAAAGTEADAGGIDRVADAAHISQRSCELAEIRMSQDGSGMDAKLEPILLKLERPPFSMFSGFAQVGAALPGEPLSLSNGAKFRVYVAEVSGHRLTIKVHGDDADGKRIARIGLRIDIGDSALIGLDGNDEYTTVVWINCSVKAR